MTDQLTSKELSPSALNVAWRTFMLNQPVMSIESREKACEAFVAAWHAGCAERADFSFLVGRLGTIRNIAEGGLSERSLPEIARLAREALSQSDAPETFSDKPFPYEDIKHTLTAPETSDVQRSIDRNTAYERDIKVLEEALGMMYDKWENGVPCFEDADDAGISLGNAFRLSDEEERQILALIPPHAQKASEGQS